MSSVLDNLPLIKPYGAPKIYPWKAQGKTFVSNGQPITVKGFTAFPIVNRFASGVDILPWLQQYNGYNKPRAFLSVPQDAWGNEYWDLPTRDELLECCKYLKSLGYTLSITLSTDSDRNKIQPTKDLINYLKGKVDNVLLEGTNEPQLYDKVPPSEYKNLMSSSGFPFSSGWYSDNKNHFGDHWRDHSERDYAWYRRGGHNIYDAYHGGGPNFPNEPALKQPGIQDEPIKPNQNGNDHLGYYAYAASCVLMGAGATFHCESAKFCKMLDVNEILCMVWFLKGLEIFPPILSYNGYDRIVEPGNEPGGPTENSRTYIVENYAVRIKQVGTEFPRPGWNPLDEYGICWKKV